jgi:hypothetical protein
MLTFLYQLFNRLDFVQWLAGLFAALTGNAT